MDLQRELEAMGAKVDLSALEADFVKTASKYAQRKGISYAAWRELGVPGRRAQEGRDLPSFVSLESERFELDADASCGRGQERLQQHHAVGAAEQGVRLARSGWGMRPTTLPASLLMPAMSSRLPLGLST